jgi:hypothetical protein
MVTLAPTKTLAIPTSRRLQDDAHHDFSDQDDQYDIAPDESDVVSPDAIDDQL